MRRSHIPRPWSGVSAALVALATLGLLLASCQSQDPPACTTCGGDPFLDDYMIALPSWSALHPTLPDRDAATAPPETTNVVLEGVEYACTSTPRELVRTPDEVIMFNPGISSLWPGSLLQGKHFAGGVGSIAPLSISERAPIRVYVDLLGPSTPRLVENPSGASVHAATVELVQELQNSGVPLATAVSFTMTDGHSVEQSALRVGIMPRFMGGTVKGQLDFEADRRLDERSTTVQFVQRLFTVTFDAPQTPDGFFATSFTQDDLDQQVRLGRIGPDNLPVYVESVTYGRILHYTLTTRAERDVVRAALNASYQGLRNGAGADLSFEQQQMLQQSSVAFVALGGTQEQALSIIRSGDLREYFAEDTALSAATPISYTVRNLADGSMATISEVVDYDATECEPLVTAF